MLTDHPPVWRELEADFSYAQLPEWAQRGMQAYIEDSVKPGGCLTAVLTMDLNGTFTSCRSPEEARDVYLWLYNAAPQACWGSREKVEAWLALREKALKGVSADDDDSSTAEAQGPAAQEPGR